MSLTIINGVSGEQFNGDPNATAAWLRDHFADASMADKKAASAAAREIEAGNMVAAADHYAGLNIAIIENVPGYVLGLPVEDASD